MAEACVIPGNGPILLSPGPLSTSTRTREALPRGWDSRDAAFSRITDSACADPVKIVHGENDYACAPLQRSGTFAVEAAPGTLVPRLGSQLVPVKLTQVESFRVGWFRLGCIGAIDASELLDTAAAIGRKPERFGIPVK
jgi:aspartate aminotransferase-like enzyme